MEKYYKAYNERYKIVHEKGMLWFSGEPSKEVTDWIEFYKINKEDNICEVGCGEGRDAINLADIGYAVTGVDISEEAIKKCNEISNFKKVKVNWIVSDVIGIKGELKNNFDWIYSVATLHMLVDDKDRKNFLNSIYNLLSPHGKFLLVSKGNGVSEYKSDTSKAFELQTRNQMKTGVEVQVAGTSYRSIKWENHKKELIEAGFKIEKILETDNQDYTKCMTVYLYK